MAFFDVLRQMGLGAQSPAPSQQDMPFGLQPTDINAARNQAMGNAGMQLLAMGMAMPSAQRAQMMAGFNPTADFNNNVMNAAQMRLMQRRLDREAQQDEQAQAEAARREGALKQITDQIKALPAGQARDAAMYFLTAGDLAKAGEIAFGRKTAFDPTTGQNVQTDYFGNPLGATPAAAPQPPAASAPGPTAIPAPISTGVPGAPQPSSVAELTDGWQKITGDRNLPPEFGGQVDQLTKNWQAITGDKTLTPDEARIISRAAGDAGNASAGIKALQDMRKQQATEKAAATQAEQQNLQNNRGAAKDLRAELDAAVKPYQTVVMAAERATQIASDPNMSPSDKIAVLYDYVKTLDPVGAVRDSDVQLAQSTQSAIGQLAQYFTAITKGGTISNDAVQAIALTMARLGDDAKARAERKTIELRGVASARQVPADMVFGPAQRGPIGPPMPMQMNPALRPQLPTPKANPYTPDVTNDLMKYSNP